MTPPLIFRLYRLHLESRGYAILHKGSKLLKSAKNKFTSQCDFTIFSSKFQQIYIVFVSCACICMSETFQTVGCISMISHISQFFILILSGFLSFQTTVYYQLYQCTAHCVHCAQAKSHGAHPVHAPYKKVV